MSAPCVILNVDDNEPNRYARTRVLLSAGFSVHDAATGQEALDLAELHYPDLILLDINLPDISGIEVCRRLRAMPAPSSLLILQISASAVTAPHATEALNNGADAYLAEPVDAAVLIATINALLRLQKAERELQSANTALAAANRDLLQSNQDLQQFAYFASHDLQEPLRQVTNFVQLISQTAAEKLTGEERDFLGHVVEGADRMEHLIRALLSYSQLGHGERVAHSLVDLNKVVDGVAANLRDRFMEAGGTTKRAALPVVVGDALQLADVFQNLLVNALKYRRPDEPLLVEITSVVAPGGATVTVRDNGQGISPAYFDLIFLPFKRLHGREIPGTGIGLAICRRIIDAHGGKIWVESHLGSGTAFHFTLQLPATFSTEPRQ